MNNATSQSNSVLVARRDDSRMISFAIETLEFSSAESVLTETLFELYEFLTAAEGFDFASSAVVDIQVADQSDPITAGIAEALIQAVRGTLQAWVLERGAKSCSVNLVISRPEQDRDRATTHEYLLSANGAFSRGSTTDLREV